MIKIQFCNNKHLNIPQKVLRGPIQSSVSQGTGEKQEQCGIFRRESTEFGQPRKDVPGLNQTIVGPGFSPVLYK